MRRYSITCDGFQPSLLEGGFSFSASDAGHKWIAENLPGSAPCDVIYQRTGEDDALGLHCVWRMEAYNNTVYTGHGIYIRELL